MATPSQNTVERVVVHPKFYYGGDNGKLQHIKPGTKLVLSEEEAERLKSKLADPAEQEVIDKTKEPAKQGK